MAFNLLNYKNYPLTALQVVIFTTPLGILTIKGWAGWHLFIGMLFSVFVLLLNKKNNPRQAVEYKSSQLHMMALVLTLPFLATLITQLLRNQFDASDLDSPSRFLIAIPILYALTVANINTAKILTLAIPLSAIASYLLIPYLPQKGWALEAGRLATYSVDPLTFGKIALGIGLMSVFIAIENAQKKLILIIAIIGAGLGMYLSIQSQSRTGWLSITFVLFFLVVHVLNKNASAIKKIITSVIIVAAISTPFLTNPQVISRVTEAIHNIKTWQPNKNTVDTSVGMRMSFWLIGSQLFIERPIKGWGNDGFKERLTDSDFSEIASQYTREFTIGAGFHSDIMQNAVRSGISGLIAYLAIFLIPLLIFIYQYRHNLYTRTASGLGIIYVCVEFVSSLSTEVLSLKSTTSYYGLIIAILVAESIKTKKSSHS